MGNRTDRELAKAIYGKKEQAGAAGATEGAKGETAEGAEPKGPRSDAELSAVMYPPRSPRYPGGDETHTNDCIRDVSGAILHEAPYEGNTLNLVMANLQQLSSADLSDLGDFGDRDCKNMRAEGADISGCGFHASMEGSTLRNAKAEGTSFKNCRLWGVDARGLQVTASTDLTGSDWSGAFLCSEDVERLKGCKGFREAKGIKVREK